MGDVGPTADSVNGRYLANLARKDWLQNLQTAYFRQRVSLHHPRVKSHYVRYFGVTSKNTHFIEQAARVLLGAEAVDRAEAHLSERIDVAMREIDGATVRAKTLLEAEGVTATPEYAQEPLEVEAKWTSPKMARYLELMIKADRMLTLLEALRLSGAITTNAYDRQVALVIRQVATVPRVALNLTMGLRKRANRTPAAPESVRAPATGDREEVPTPIEAPSAPSAIAA